MVNKQIEQLKQEAQLALETYEYFKERHKIAIEAKDPDSRIQGLRCEVFYFDGKQEAYNTALKILLGGKD